MTVPTQVWTVEDVPDAEDEDNLIARYIKPHPHKFGRAYAYLFDSGPSVSTIVRGLQTEKGDVTRRPRPGRCLRMRCARLSPSIAGTGSTSTRGTCWRTIHSSQNSTSRLAADCFLDADLVSISLICSVRGATRC